MRLLAIVLSLVLATPTFADKKNSAQKIKIDNKPIDAGMQESGQKASLKNPATTKETTGRSAENPKPTGDEALLCWRRKRKASPCKAGFMLHWCDGRQER